jgi:hypothetical protein
VTLDAYLVRLERLLPRSARLRALPEVREHLRDAAARHQAAGRSPAEAEIAATEEFGAVEDVASRLAHELAIRETRVAGVLSLAAVAFFVFPLYVIPENTLHPATWAEKPDDILVLQRTAIGFWLAAGALAGASAILAWTRWSRLASLMLLCTVIAVTGSFAVSTALVVLWFSYTPSTPNFALAAPAALACLAVCAVAAWWALSSRGRLPVAD